MSGSERTPADPPVYLVGAGPGDPGLMTRRALELIAGADAILYDRLVPPGALDGARPDAQLIDVGKQPGGERASQKEINDRLVALGLAGKRVVRLKGGDPFVFGRGGEEAEALAAAGVEYEVVPGVTAGLASPAYAGIPTTHRGLASAVALVTAHEDPSKEDSAIDWRALASFPGTLVLYMGVARLGEVTARLVDEGRDPSEPAAIVERGTLPGQRTVTGTLADVAERAAEAELQAPAVTVLGSVAGLREALAWFERRPLHGRSVAITRARAQASGLAGRLADLGADVVEAPVIRIVPRPIEGALATALDRIREYALVCLTSPNGAALLMDALARRGLDARALAGATVAAIGPGTAAALVARGVRADVVPERSVAEVLVEALDHVELRDRRALVARAVAARDLLPDALRERGAEVDVVALYDTVAEPLSEAQIEGITGADYVTFTSSSTVTNLADALAAAGAALNESTRVVSIGPITSATARELGIDVHVEADRHDVEGLVDALVTDSQTRSTSRA